MRPLFIISLLLLLFLFLFSCKDKDKNFDGTTKNYTPIKPDTSCINPCNMAYFELRSKNFDTVLLAIRTKLTSVLGDKIFDENAIQILGDSIKKAAFSLDSHLTPDDIQIDTTNLLHLNDDLKYYMSDELTPRRNLNWRYYFTQSDQFTFQHTSNFEIGYTITPCIKQILRQEGQFKRKRKGNSLPDYSKGSDAHVDRVNIYDCLLNICILIEVDDKSEMVNSKRQFYEVKISDTAKVFTGIDILTQK